MLSINFHPYPSEDESENVDASTHLLETPYQLEPPINCLKRAQIPEVISNLKPKKSSGYYLMTGGILKELPIVGIKSYPVTHCFLTQRILPKTMDSRTDHPRLEARKTSKRVNIRPANKHLTHYI
jgi:hypothetical protein